MGAIKDFTAAVKETDLWDLFRAGNRDAYTELVSRYAKALFNYGYRFNQDEAFIEDCIQDLFFDLWEGRERINATPAVKGYLFKAMRHRVFREQANWQRNQALDESYDFLVDFSIETRLIAEVDVTLLSTRVQQVLNELPPRHREVLYLRFFEELDFNEIEQIMGINRQSVHNLLQRAYKSFKANWAVFVFVLMLIKTSKLIH
ncbi:RNA polymerase sigma factor [Mucilaginibacter kameinonensis]|uniref:RNA polymerase sigma factor n=1 Tax=Mucilaginibacter kameinonensis TaxID=452286 RepID=UPI000EF77742|nr:sigma-70 family RNA polymerase sigma factor [Mucilaginibacter kameinonensis]